MIRVLTHPTTHYCDACGIDTRRGVHVEEVIVVGAHELVLPIQYLCRACRFAIGQALVLGYEAPVRSG